MNSIELFNKALPLPLDNEELVYYEKLASSGDMVAQNELIVHSLRYVLLIINKKFFNIKMEYEELFSIGVIGLIKAARTFDLKKPLFFLLC